MPAPVQNDASMAANEMRRRALAWLTAMTDTPPVGAVSRNMSSWFDPQGVGYDYATAVASGMGPSGAEAGVNAGHWGSVAPATEIESRALGLPAGSYMLLKGASHPTFPLAVQGEEARGAKVERRGERYWSIPQERR